MNKRDAQMILKNAGYPLVVDGKWGKWSRRALRDASRMWAFTEKQVGFSRPKVGGTLKGNRVKMLEKLKTNGGHCSPNFTYLEFRCKGTTRGFNGPEDNWIRCQRKLIVKLEEHRRRFGGPISIISAGRSARYNAALGGATLSEHRYGWKWYTPRRVCTAVDINPKNHYTQVRASGIWGGIGYNVSTGNVAHVDTRLLSATWTYPR